MRSLRPVWIALLALTTAACLKSTPGGSSNSNPVDDAGTVGPQDAGIDAGQPEPDAGRQPMGDGFLLDESGAPLRALSFDFGRALLGSTLELRAQVRNDGDALLEATALTSVPDPATGFAFDADGFTLAPGATRQMIVVFHPTAPGPFSTELTIHFRNAVEDHVTLTLAGTGVDYACQLLPSEGLDFGTAALGLSEVRTAYLVNNSEFDWSATLDGVGGETDPDAFTVDGSAEGTHLIPAGTSVSVAVTFSPTHLGRHRARLLLSAPVGCEPQSIELTGNGVEDVLDCDPKVRVVDGSGAVHWQCRVDFGFVPPQLKQTQEMTFRNLGNRSITLSSWGIDQSGVTGAVFALETAGTGVAIPAGGSATVALSFTPAIAGAREALFTYFSDDPKQARGEVKLVGTGGGPQVEVAPTPLDFGITRVAAFDRTLAVRNTGWDVAGTSEDNLRFAALTSGIWLERAPEVAGSTEFRVAWPPAGYSAAGVAAGASIDVTVTLDPTAAGNKSATLRLYTNDRRQPQIDVPLIADVRVIPPCILAASPASLDFGNVDLGLTRTLKTSIRNTSADPLNECLVTGIQLGTASSPTFAIAGSLPANLTLKGGEQVDVAVQFAPTAGGAQTGALEITMANPGTPLAPIALSGTSVQSCLSVSPPQFDFGTVQQNCNSRDQVITIFNGCAVAVSLTSISFQTGSSAAFRVTQTQVLPSVIGASGSMDFRVTYKPTGLTADRGVILVQSNAVTTPASQPLPVAVTGKGASTATRTDSFTVDRKVDVLLIVDDSCSMSTVQTQLAASFSNFMQEAVSQSADYRLAVTTTSNEFPTDPNGRFVPLTSTTRIITPATPNAAQVFATNVQVGINGSAFEKLLRPAYLALSSPLVGGTNAGFLRPDASLRIFVVSDATDQDAVPQSYYERFFLGLKDGDRDRFSMSGLLATQATAPAGCYYDDYNSGQSTRVRDIIADTGGLTEEICTGDFAGAFTRLGRAIFGLRSRHFLTATPDFTGGNQISVQLNGQPFPAVGPSGETRWTYNSTLNAIDTTAQANLTSGAVLTVSYPVPCL